MADAKTTALSGFTPILTDLLYGVDDPGGTPVSGQVTFAAARTLIESNLVTPVINGFVSLFGEAAGTLAQRNGTSAQILRVYNTWTDASNYERGKIGWNANVLEILAESGGTGSNRAMLVQAPSSVTIKSTLSSISFAVSTGTRWIVAAVASASEFRPNVDNADSIGSTTKRVKNFFLSQFFEMDQMTAPAAGGATTARLFCEDNGAGKTRLMAQFGSGAAQQIAIEP